MAEKPFTIIENFEHQIAYQKDNKKIICSFSQTDTHFILKMNIDGSIKYIEINFNDYLSKNKKKSKLLGIKFPKILLNFCRKLVRIPILIGRLNAEINNAVSNREKSDVPPMTSSTASIQHDSSNCHTQH